MNLFACTSIRAVVTTPWNSIAVLFIYLAACAVTDHTSTPHITDDASRYCYYIHTQLMTNDFEGGRSSYLFIDTHESTLILLRKGVLYMICTNSKQWAKIALINIYSGSHHSPLPTHCEVGSSCRHRTQESIEAKFSATTVNIFVLRRTL